jgi:hypothetical protein
MILEDTTQKTPIDKIIQFNKRPGCKTITNASI